jgi:hypothetical protein
LSRPRRRYWHGFKPHHAFDHAPGHALRPITWLLIRIAWLLILFHLGEIAVWALFFWWHHCLPDAESSFYFSGVTYATLGYGDLVLPNEWRLSGPLEALIGALMCGLSVAFFFGVLARTSGHKIGETSN